MVREPKIPTLMKFARQAPNHQLGSRYSPRSSAWSSSDTYTQTHTHIRGAGKQKKTNGAHGVAHRVAALRCTLTAPHGVLRFKPFTIWVLREDGVGNWRGVMVEFSRFMATWRFGRYEGGGDGGSCDGCVFIAFKRAVRNTPHNSTYYIWVVLLVYVMYPTHSLCAFIKGEPHKHRNQRNGRVTQKYILADITWVFFASFFYLAYVRICTRCI